MTCNEMFYASIDNIKNAYKQVCIYNKEFREDLEKCRTENIKLRKLVDGWNFCSKTKSSTSDDCIGCPLFIQTLHSYRCTKDECMRELGVKVNYK